MGSFEFRLDTVNAFPDNLLSIADHTKIRDAFPNPTLVSIAGTKNETVFLSTLLHGNEPTGFYVLKKLAAYLKENTPKRNLKVFVGNVYAAEFNERFLEDQDDLNRVWLGGDSPGELLAQEVKDNLPDALYATIDIHNNTGNNPMYACVSQLKPDHIYLGSLYSRTLVYFVNPKNALSRAFSESCPSVTLECGRADGDMGAEKAFDFVKDVIQSETLTHRPNLNDIDIYETVARLIVDPECTYSFNNEDADLQFVPELDKLNFSQLEKGTSLAKVRVENPIPVKAYDEEDNEVTPNYLAFESGEMKLKESLTPAMLTMNKAIVEKDCLGYLMRKITPLN